MRIQKLDGLRGVFSLMIVIFHFDESLTIKALTSNFFVDGSFLFVDFFFVLSGFVISTNYNGIGSGKQFSLFLKKRIIRLFPLLLFSTTVVLVLELIFNLFWIDLLVSPKSISSIFHEYFDSILFLNSTTLLGATPGLNSPSWSISAELILYLTFGFVTLYMSKRNRIFAFLLILMLSIGFCIYKGEFWFMHDFGYIRGLISFITGHFVYVLSGKIRNLPAIGEIVLIPSLIILFYLFSSYSGQTQQMLFLGFVPLFFGLSTLLLLKTDGPLSHLLASSPFRFLGNISYSVYLNHGIVIVIIPRFFYQYLGIEKNQLTLVLITLLTLGILLLYSYMTYMFIETRSSLFLKKNIL